MMKPKVQSKATIVDEARRDRRRAANRKSARKSRHLEMVMLEELQHSHRDLCKKNNILRRENKDLKEGVLKLKSAFPWKKKPQYIPKPPIIDQALQQTMSTSQNISSLQLQRNAGSQQDTIKMKALLPSSQQPDPFGVPSSQQPDPFGVAMFQHIQRQKTLFRAKPSHMPTHAIAQASTQANIQNLPHTHLVQSLTEMMQAEKMLQTQQLNSQQSHQASIANQVNPFLSMLEQRLPAPTVSTPAEMVLHKLSQAKVPGLNQTLLQASDLGGRRALDLLHAQSVQTKHMLGSGEESQILREANRLVLYALQNPNAEINLISLQHAGVIASQVLQFSKNSTWDIDT